MQKEDASRSDKAKDFKPIAVEDLFRLAGIDATATGQNGDDGDAANGKMDVDGEGGDGDDEAETSDQESGDDGIPRTRDRLSMCFSKASSSTRASPRDPAPARGQHKQQSRPAPSRPATKSQGSSTPHGQRPEPSVVKLDGRGGRLKESIAELLAEVKTEFGKVRFDERQASLCITAEEQALLDAGLKEKQRIFAGLQGKLKTKMSQLAGSANAGALTAQRDEIEEEQKKLRTLSLFTTVMTGKAQIDIDDTIGAANAVQKMSFSLSLPYILKIHDLAAQRFLTFQEYGKLCQMYMRDGREVSRLTACLSKVDDLVHFCEMKVETAVVDVANSIPATKCSITANGKMQRPFPVERSNSIQLANAILNASEQITFVPRELAPNVRLLLALLQPDSESLSTLNEHMDTMQVIILISINTYY